MSIPERVMDVVCGDSHAIALLQNGEIYGWGEGITYSTTIIKDLRESLGNENFLSMGIN